MIKRWFVRNFLNRQFFCKNLFNNNKNIEKIEEKVEEPKQMLLDRSGNYYINKIHDDEHFLFTQNIQAPQREPGARYFSLTHQGKIFHFFNAQNYSYGRMCVEISNFIRGKNKPTFNPCTENKGDICVVVNADKIKLPGKKIKFKEFIYHTGFPGGLKRFTYEEMLLKKPELLIYNTVSKMMPKNKLRKNNLLKLRVFRGQMHDLGKHFPQFNYNKPVDLSKLIDLNIDEDTKIIGKSPNLKKEDMPGDIKNLEEELSLESAEEIMKIKDKNKKIKLNDLKKLDRYNRGVWRKLKAMRHYIAKPKRKKKTLFENDDFHIYRTDKELKKYKADKKFEEENKLPDIEDE